jgi:exopolysaccharide biosynthesis polyprenyl glycosylphosphotransferase
MISRDVMVGKIFVFTRIITDILLIPFIVIIAYGLKFKVGWVLQRVFSLPVGKIYEHAQVEPYLDWIRIVIFLWMVSFYVVGLYRARTGGIMPEVDEEVKVIKGVTVATVGIMAFSVIYPDFPTSRYVIFYSWLIGIIVLSISRAIIHKIEIFLMCKGVGSNPALVIGVNSDAQDVVEKMHLFPALGLKYIGTLADQTPEYCHYTLREKLNILGKVAEYKSLIKEYNIKKVFVALPDVSETYLKELLEFCKYSGVELLKLSSFQPFMSSLVQVQSFDGMPFITEKSLERVGLDFIFKRIFDFMAALILIVLISPLFVLISFLIKLTSPRGSILYIQERVGKNGVCFNMCKFRTMVPNAEASTGPVMVSEDSEGRYTRIGSLLRKMSLDELPQLFNIIKGDMSLVGPRPERPFFVEKFKKEVPGFELRHQVKGGLTGWAQINGRSVLTQRPDHKFKYDMYYIKNRTFVLDIKILIKTFFVVLRGEEAY